MDWCFNQLAILRLIHIGSILNSIHRWKEVTHERIKLVIEGDPIAKTRHRCGCHGKFPTAFDPQIKSEMNPMRKVILAWWNSYFDDPDSIKAEEARLIARSDTFYVTMQFFMPITRSCPAGLANLKLWGIISCNEKPDFDNLAKFYADCMTGIVWPDDKMVVCGISHKVRYSKNPRTEISIMSKKELTLDERQLSVFKAFSPEDMRDFITEANELSMLLGCNAQYFRDNDQIPGEPFLSEASMLLIKFASRFSDKLKKIAKLDD